MIPGGGACSELRSRHCTPAWETERDSVSKKKKKRKRKRKKKEEKKRRPTVGGRTCFSKRVGEGDWGGVPTKSGLGQKQREPETHRAAHFCSGSWRCSLKPKPPSETGCGPPGRVAGDAGRGGTWCWIFSTFPRGYPPSSPCLLRHHPLFIPCTLRFYGTHKNRIYVCATCPVGHWGGFREPWDFFRQARKQVSGEKGLTGWGQRELL